MATESRTFRGTPESAALMQPWVAPSPANRGGIFLGVNLRTRKPEYFDPWQLKMDGTISSTQFAVYGDKGGGKTTFQKAMAIRGQSLQAGMINGVPDSIRTRINDRKPEDGRPEYEAITEFLHSLTIRLNQQASINVFDPKMNMTEFDLNETTVNICEQISGAKLIRFQPLAIQVGIHRMLQLMPDKASPEMLEYILRYLNAADLQDYFDSISSGLDEQYEAAIAERGDTLPAESRPVRREHNIPFEVFQHDAALVSSYLGRLLRGDYGGIIGGTGSLRDALSQPMVTFDWSGVNEQARTLLMSMFWKWQTVALNNNDLSLIPHLDFSDEEADALTNLMYVRFQAAFVKKARAFHTASFRAVQYRRDIARAGADGSEIRALCEGILLGMGAEFYFRQPEDDNVLDDMVKRGISEQDARYLTNINLPPGVVGVKYPNRPFELIQILIGPTEMELVKTNAAAERMANRQPVHTMAVIKDRQARLQALASVMPPIEQE